MLQLSNQVANESFINRIPSFSTNSSILTCVSSLSILSLSELESSVSLSSLNEVLGCSSCKCPHVLVADDDDFQEFYYRTLFQKSLDFDGLVVDKENFQLEVVKSGEDMTTRYRNLNKCCEQFPILIIIDYDMGQNNMTGVATAISLRKQGYTGPIILRTSEKIEYLRKQHQDFDILLEQKVINILLDKESHTKTKQTIQDMLSNCFN